MKDLVYGRIYLITNLVNNKKYIGQTISSINQRFRSHCSKTNQLIGFSIVKYGKNNFKIEEIYISFNKEDLNLKERELIKCYNSMVPIGYNVELGGNCSGKKTKEQLLKMSETTKLWHINNPGFKPFDKVSDETRFKMSESQKKASTVKKKERWIKLKEDRAFEIKAKNLITNEIKYYKSINNCSDDLKISTSRIGQALRGGKGKTWCDGFIFAKEEDAFIEHKRPKYIYKSSNRDGYNITICGEHIGYTKTYEEAELKLNEFIRNNENYLLNKRKKTLTKDYSKC